MPLDLREYLCPAGTASYLLVGVNGTEAYEVCRSIVDTKGYGRFLKNSTGHYETRWADERFIYLGLDTSGLRENRVYAQYELDGANLRYGAVWVNRFVEVGDVTKRDPLLLFLDAQGRHLESAPGGVSFMRVAAHHPNYTFAETRRSAQDVVELHWTSDAAGRDVIEKYFYAKGLGLLGFDYLRDRGFHSQFAGFVAEVPTFYPLPNFVEPVPPPGRPGVIVPPAPEVVIPANPGNGVAMVVSAPSGLKQRPAPGASNTALRILPDKTPVTMCPETKTKPIDGEVWVFCRTSNDLPGWCASRYLAQPPAPLPGFKPRLPFDWQYLITARMNEARSFGKHEGADFAPSAKACSAGKYPILAIAEGVVEDVRTWGEAAGLGKLLDGYGIYVRIRHETADGVYKSWYGHLAAPAVCEGDVVKAGDVVGVLGTSGNSTGEHLHLTVQHIGKGLKGYVVDDVIDPLPLFGLK